MKTCKVEFSKVFETKIRSKIKESISLSFVNAWAILRHYSRIVNGRCFNKICFIKS